MAFLCRSYFYGVLFELKLLKVCNKVVQHIVVSTTLLYNTSLVIDKYVN